jgi:putative MATE family efflux protein
MQEIHQKKVKIKTFVREMLPLAIPVAAHEFLMSSVNMVDTIMVGHISETAIASVNLANQVFFVFILMMVGVCSGSGIFIAQYFGDKDTKGIQRTIGLTLIAAISMGLIFSVASLCFAEEIISFYTKDADVISASVDYLKITGWTFPLTALSFSYGMSLRTMRQAKIPLFVSIFALAVSTGLNFVFIFGKLGFPKMGVEGAALATLFARLMELSVMISILRLKKSIILAPLKRLFAFPRGFVNKYIITNYPVMLNEMGWVIGVTLYNKIYAGISTQALTAVVVADNIFMLFFVLFFGTSSATAILIGNKIGAREFARAQDYARIVHKIIPPVSIFFGLILFSVSSLFPRLYGVEADTLQMTISVLWVYAFILTFKSFNLHTVNGILRSGGDTKYALIMDIGGIWLIGLPMALFARDVLGLPLIGVVCFLLFEEIIKAIVGFFRVKSSKWINRVI